MIKIAITLTVLSEIGNIVPTSVILLNTASVFRFENIALGINCDPHWASSTSTRTTGCIIGCEIQNQISVGIKFLNLPHAPTFRNINISRSVNKDMLRILHDILIIYRTPNSHQEISVRI